MSKFTTIINIILIIAIIITLIVQVNSSQKKFEIYQQDLDNLTQRIGSIEYSIKQLEISLYINQLQLQDLWLSSISPDALQKIQEWETQNVDFAECDKGERYDLVINRNYYDKSISVARVLVHIFDKGEMVFERTGEVHCHLYPIDSNKMTPIDCNLLCKDNNNETQA